jgi:hypothetical protein
VKLAQVSQLEARIKSRCRGRNAAVRFGKASEGMCTYEEEMVCFPEDNLHPGELIVLDGSDKCADFIQVMLASSLNPTANINSHNLVLMGTQAI